jgi:hypothetical protein
MKNKVHVGQPGLMLLDSYCRLVTEAFGPCYLVGECLTRRDYRHVDIRVIMEDDAFCDLFGGTWSTGHNSTRWVLVCSGLTKLLTFVSGVAVDFQIQPETWSTTFFDGQPKVRIGGQNPSMEKA